MDGLDDCQNVNLKRKEKDEEILGYGGLFIRKLSPRSVSSGRKKRLVYWGRSSITLGPCRYELVARANQGDYLGIKWQRRNLAAPCPRMYNSAPAGG